MSGALEICARRPSWSCCSRWCSHHCWRCCDLRRMPPIEEQSDEFAALERGAIVSRMSGTISGKERAPAPGFRFPHPGYSYNNRLHPTRDIAHQAECFLDHRSRDVEMGAGPDPAVHHGKQNPALTQLRDHSVSGDARAFWVEENQVGFGLLH